MTLVEIPFFRPRVVSIDDAIYSLIAKPPLDDKKSGSASSATLAETNDSVGLTKDCSALRLALRMRYSLCSIPNQPRVVVSFEHLLFPRLGSFFRMNRL